MYVHRRKERFPSKQKSKLMPRADGRAKVLEKVNDNAYKIDLSKDYGVFCTFNVANLKLDFEDDKLENLRAYSSIEGAHDVSVEGQTDELRNSLIPQEIKVVAQLI